MNSSVLLVIKAIIAGFTMAAPVGPIGLLCISNTLRHSFVAGLATGIGAASADAIYGFLAASGVSFFGSLLLQFKIALQAIGGFLLLYLSYREFVRIKVPQVTPHLSSKLILSIIGSTLLLTLTNPMTLLLLLGIFSTFAPVQSFSQVKLLSLGIFCGSMLWWILLTTIVTITKKRIPIIWLERIHRFSALLLLLLGILSLLSATSTTVCRLSKRHQYNLLHTTTSIKG